MIHIATVRFTSPPSQSGNHVSDSRDDSAIQLNRAIDTDSVATGIQYIGPFTITKVLSPLSYKLKLPTSWKIHPIFHASLLTPYHENEIHGPNFPAPPPDLIDNEEEYEIERILKHRGPPKNRSYLIRWKGYTAEEDTWLKEAELGNATEFLYAYKKRIKISPKRKT